jgi:hypothetical protein
MLERAAKILDALNVRLAQKQEMPFAYQQTIVKAL